MHQHLTITAHSGCEGTEQDSIESVRTGIILGADIVEIDVRKTEEGLLVISHNHCAGYGDCVELEDVFRIVAKDGRVRVNCDIKETEIVQDVLAAAVRHGLCNNSLILSGSVTPYLLKKDSTITSRAAVHLNIEEILKQYCVENFEMPGKELAFEPPWEVTREFQKELTPHIQTLMEDGLRLGAQAINLPYSEWARQYFAGVYTLGLPISVWTVNVQEDMERLIGYGILNLTTLNVRQALSVRKAALGY